MYFQIHNITEYFFLIEKMISKTFKKICFKIYFENDPKICLVVEKCMMHRKFDSFGELSSLLDGIIEDQMCPNMAYEEIN